jgi:hypothetical protein
MILVTFSLSGCYATSKDYTLYQVALTKAKCEVILSVDTKFDSLYITPMYEADNYLLIEMSDLDRRNGRLDHYVDAGPWKHYLRGTDEPYFLCTEFTRGKEIKVESELVSTDFAGDGTDYHVGYTANNSTDNYLLVQVEYKDKKYYDIVTPYHTMQNLDLFRGVIAKAKISTFELSKL